MRTIYAALLRFADSPSDALPIARAHTRRWVSEPWGGWPKNLSAVEGTFQGDDTTARWRTFGGEMSRLWEMTVDTAFVDDASMREETVIQIGTDADSAFAFIQVSLRSTTRVMAGQVVYENDSPDIVPLLVSSVRCADGDMDLTTTASLLSRSQERTFTDLVGGTSRHLPVVLFVLDPAFDEDQADAAGAALAGLAHVFCVPRERVPSLIERTGIEMPYGACVYLWWASEEVKPRRPQAFRADALAPSAWGTPAWRVIRSIFSAAAFRVSPPALARQLEAEATRQRIRHLEQRATSTVADTDLLHAWEADLRQLEHTQRDLAWFELENDRIQQDLNALLVEFDLAVAGATEAVTAGREPSGDPDTLVEAVRHALMTCSSIEFLPEAITSAESWQFARPGAVLAALEQLDELAHAWREDTLHGSFMMAARSAGLPWRPAISRTAQTQYRQDYLRRIGDTEVLLGPHLAWGTSPDNALRVYLYLDSGTRTVYVGHVGRHLRDTSNPHL